MAPAIWNHLPGKPTTFNPTYNPECQDWNNQQRFLFVKSFIANMPDPTLITGLISGSLSGIMAAIRFAEVWIKLQDAPEDARTFLRLIKQVDSDLKHAGNLREHLAAKLKQQPKFYCDWIILCICTTIEAVDHMVQFLDFDTTQPSPLLDTRVRWVLMNKPALMSQERSLQYAHASLLAGINAMHLLMSQEGPSQSSPVATWGQQPASPGLRLSRASATTPSKIRPRLLSDQSSTTSSSLSSNLSRNASTDSSMSSFASPRTESGTLSELPCSPATSKPATPW